MGNFKEFGKGILKFIGVIFMFFVAGITSFTIKNPNFVGTIKQGMINLFSNSYLLINYLMNYGKVKVESSVFIFYVMGSLFALASILLITFGIGNISKSFGAKIPTLFLILGSLIFFFILALIIPSMFKADIGLQEKFQLPFTNNMTMVEPQVQNLTADIILGQQNLTNATGGY